MGPAEVLGTRRISRADFVRRGLSSKPAGGTQTVWDRARRRVHHEPALQAYGTPAGGMVVLEDRDELLEREVFLPRSQVLGGAGAPRLMPFAGTRSFTTEATEGHR